MAMKRLSTLLANQPLRIGIIPGDGVGREVIPWGKKVLEAVESMTPAKYEYVDLEAGFHCFEKTGQAVPDKTIDELGKCRGALFGAAASPSPPPFGYEPPIVTLRRKLGTFANLRPLRSVPVDTVGARNNVDMVVVRENTECLYGGNEKLTVEGGKVAIGQRIVSEAASKRIAKVAFELAKYRAKRYGRNGHVTIVHKANVLGLSEGLFLETCRAVAKDYPDIIVDDMVVDGFLYKAILHPGDYDVVVSTNTFGNIISNTVAPMVGGLGMVSGVNEGTKFTLAEPVHGTKAHLQGGRANPIATMRAAANLANRISPDMHLSSLFEKSLQEVLSGGDVLTKDLGGTATTDEMGDKVLRHFKSHLTETFS